MDREGRALRFWTFLRHGREAGNSSSGGCAECSPKVRQVKGIRPAGRNVARRFSRALPSRSLGDLSGFVFSWGFEQLVTASMRSCGSVAVTCRCASAFGSSDCVPVSSSRILALLQDVRTASVTRRFSLEIEPLTYYYNIKGTGFAGSPNLPQVAC